MTRFRCNRRGSAGRGRTGLRVVPGLERLETRTLPAINVLSTIEGINRSGSGCACEPSDTDVAVGPAQVVETVNTAIAFYDKGTGDQLFREPLRQFFAPVGAGQGTSLSDPLVTYDDLAGRFFVLVLEYGTQHTYLTFGVSDTSNPLDGFSEMQRYETTVTLPDGTKLGSDYPKLGYNAEAYMVTLNMDLINGAYVDPVQEKVLTIAKDTYTVYDVDVDAGSANPVYAMAPATMHGAPAGSPLYAVREVTRFGGDSLDVIAVTDLLSNTPTFTEYIIPIFPYARPPKAIHPPNRQIETFESFLMNVDWRDNRLVATMHIGLEGDPAVHVAWFDFDTSGDAPVLTQAGVIDRGPDVHTYFSAIAVNAHGDLGLTFMESSATEPVSMYVTGQPAFAYGTGKMLPPVDVVAGQGVYSGGRGGDFAGIETDPEAGDVFWAANMYKAEGGFSLWGTRIASFVVDAARGPRLPAGGQLAILADRRVAAPPAAAALSPVWPGTGCPDPVAPAPEKGNAVTVWPRPRTPRALDVVAWATALDREDLGPFALG